MNLHGNETIAPVDPVDLVPIDMEPIRMVSEARRGASARRASASFRSVEPLLARIRWRDPRGLERTLARTLVVDVR